MIKDFNIQRCITFYEKDGDAFEGERILLEEEISLDDLKEIFKTSKEDPLFYNQYDIDLDVANSIKDKVDFDFDFDKYDYFLETFNIDLSQKAEKGVRLKNR